MKKTISIVVPIYNEEEILHERVAFLENELTRYFDEFEIILSENGSGDGTKEIAKELSMKNPLLKSVIDNGVPDYGQALIQGIDVAEFDRVAIMEIDYLDLDYLYRSYDLLDDFDLVIGSKKLSPGIDQRPVKRRFLTSIYNILIRIVFRLKVTETHGLKTFNKSKIKPVMDKCVTSHAVYPSEMVIRAEKMGLKLKEIHLSKPLVEIRTTRINAMRRLRRTLEDIFALRKALKTPTNAK